MSKEAYTQQDIHELCQATAKEIATFIRDGYNNLNTQITTALESPTALLQKCKTLSKEVLEQLVVENITLSG